MICKKCGSNIADTSKFCGYCGAPVEETKTVESVQNIFESSVPNVEEPVQNSTEVQVNPIPSVVPVEPIQSATNEVVTEQPIQNVAGKMASQQEPVQNPTEVQINPIPSVVPVEPIQSVTNEVVTEQPIQNVASGVTPQQEPVQSATNDVPVVDPIFGTQVTPTTQASPNVTNQTVEMPTMASIQGTILSSDAQNNVDLNQVNESLVSNTATVNPNTQLENEGVQVQPSTLTQNQSINENLQPTKIQEQVNPQVPPKKQNKLPLKGVAIALVCVVVVLGIVLVTMMLGDNKSKMEPPLTVLKKSLGNFGQKANTSATLNGNVLVEGNNDSYKLAFTVKYQNNVNDHNLLLTVKDEESNNEYNLYSIINNKGMDLYLKSSVIDLLGVTSSQEDIWVNYKLDSSVNIESIYSEEDLSIIDEKHFVFVGKDANGNHYQLILDKELMNNEKLTQDQMDSLNSLFGEGIEKYVIDFYINDLNEITKIKMELNDFDPDLEISKISLNLEFTDLNSTVVNIPDEILLNDSMSLNEYLETYAIFNEDNSDTNQD